MDKAFDAVAVIGDHLEKTFKLLDFHCFADRQQIFLESDIPVSYTHLDVYKRQQVY